MDFSQAALLIAMVVGLSQLAKRVLPDKLVNDPKVVAAVVLGAALAAVFLTAESVWGNEQIVGGQELGKLDWASKLLVSVLLAGAAAFTWEGLTAIKNVGVPMPTKAQQTALDEGAARYAAQADPDAGGSHDGGSHDEVELKFKDDVTP